MPKLAVQHGLLKEDIARMSADDLKQDWETGFYPMWMLGGVLLSPMRVPNASPIPDKNLAAPMGPGILSRTGAGVVKRCRAAAPGSGDDRKVTLK